MNIEQQSQLFLAGLETRKRNPATTTTLKAYRSYLTAHILPAVGHMDLATFENGAMKTFVAGLEGLAPSTVVSIANVVKGIISSAQDANGNELYPRPWNNDFIDLPIVSVRDQKAPIIGQEALREAVSGARAQMGALYILLAGSGLRISESLALRAGPDDGVGSFWVPEQSKLIIRGQMKEGKFVEPKTAAGFREVDIVADMNHVLCRLNRSAGNLLFTKRNGHLTGLPLSTAEDMAKRDGIPGFHSLRRFRVTRLREVGAPEDLLKFWIGHSGKDISDRYSKLAQNITVRKEWAEKAGLGFAL